MALIQSPAESFETTVVDEETRMAAQCQVDSARAGGLWLEADIEHFLKKLGIDLATFAAAVRGDPVSWRVQGVLVQISIQGMPEPDSADITRHIEWLVAPARGPFDDALFEISYGKDGPNMARLFGLDEICQAVDFAVEQNAAGMNVYIGAGLRLPETPRNRRASGADFYVATVVPVDIDKDFDLTVARLKGVCDIGARVMTGSAPEARGQVWIRLMEPCDCADTFADAIAGAVGYSGGDQGAKGAARIMRLAGTVSWPSSPKRSRGYRAELTTLTIDQTARPVDVTTLALLGPASAPAGLATHRGVHEGPTGIERGLSGRVVNGRETHWRNICFAVILEYQATNGADPTADELFDQAYKIFSDPTNVKHDDQRWTSPQGQTALRKRAEHTLKRMRAGALGKWGLGSIDTGEGMPQAEAVRTDRATRAVASAAEHTDALRVCSQVEFLDPWEKPHPPSFPLTALPAVLRDFATMQAISTGGDVSAAAMAILAACGGALDQQISLKMKRTGDWYVRPRLWVLLVGDPSSKKSPLIRAATKSLRAADSDAMKRFKAAQEAWLATQKAGNSDNADGPSPPVRLLRNDTTAEACVKDLSGQPRGLLMVLDELSGLIGAMEKYSGGKGSAADRAMWLQAYDGGPYTADRIGRGLTYVQNLAVSFLAGIQPNRLQQLTNLSSDGLLQRFLPVMMAQSTIPQELEDEAPAARFDSLINALLAVPVHTLKPSEEALEVFEAFQRQIHHMEQLEGLGDAFRTFLGKLTGVQGSLAAILHYVDCPAPASLSRLSGAAAAAATQILTEFVIPHAHIFYGLSADAGNWDLLRQIASYILTQDKDRFTASDLTAGVRGLRGLDQRVLAEKLSPLVAGGWLDEDGPARPPKAWNVTTGLRGHFADRRCSERAHKAEVQRLIVNTARERGETKS